MQLGAFSLSLSVKDLAKSKAFYEALGFSEMGGMPEQSWLIMKNGDTVIGLFQGMFEGNMMTFNPRWDQSAQEVPGGQDIREIHAELKSAGIVTSELEAASDGPANFMLTDPDGNMILLDQHV